MERILLTAIVDDQRMITIPAPAGSRVGDVVEVEITFLRTRKKVLTQEEWVETVRLVSGIFKDDPMEIPDDPPPTPIDFD